MNSRTLEISKQVPNWNSLGVYIAPYQPSLEQFAQLIVEHCNECVRDILREEQSELTYSAANAVQKRIKEYFQL